MPRGIVVPVVLALALFAARGPAASAKSPLPTGFNVVAAASLYRGVDYAKLAKPNTPVVAHVARIAPGAAVDLRVVNAMDKITTSPSELVPTSSICRQLHCIVGLNGDFNRAGTPLGAVIVDGRLLHSPDPARPQLTVTGDGRLTAGPFPWTGSLSTPDGTRIPVTTVNGIPTGDGLALYTPAHGARTDPSGSRVELVVRAAGGVGTLNAPTDLELKGLRSGAGPIPTDGAVLSGEGVAAQQLRDLWARVQSGARPHAELLVSSPIDAQFSLGAEPVVLRDGGRALPWRDPNVINPRQPHTLVGWNKAGEVFLVAIDGRQPASEGMTMAEAADFLLALGATDAVNLDGGGGTTFVAGGSVWNRPSDNDPAHPAQYSERGTANAFVVMPRPGAPLPGAAPPPPQPVPRSASTADPAPGGTGDGPSQSLPWDDSPSDAGTFGPLNGIGDDGTHLADGELPVGPAPRARAALGSGTTRLSEPGRPAADEVSGGPGSVPSSGSNIAPGGHQVRAGDAAAPSRPGQAADAERVARGRRFIPVTGRAATAAAALLLSAVEIRRRRRRRLTLSLLIEHRRDPFRVAPAAQDGSTTRSSRWITSWGAPSGRSPVREPASSASSTEL